MSRSERSTFCSPPPGSPGLIYESVWTHYLKLFLGHAAYAQSLVLAVFMGGMAAGAAWCARLSARLANPLAAYAAVEAAIGLAALVFHPLFVALTDWSYDWLLPGLGSEWLALAAKLALSCALILPQSVLLGMTFPLMSAGLARAHRDTPGESLAMLYFTNSLGAAPACSQRLRAHRLGRTARDAARRRRAQPRHRRARSGSRAPGAARAGQSKRRNAGLAPAARGRLLHRPRVLHLRDRLDPHAVARARRLDPLVRGDAATFILGLALGGLAVRGAPTRARAGALLAWVQVVMGLAALADAAGVRLRPSR